MELKIYRESHADYADTADSNLKYLRLEGFNFNLKEEIEFSSYLMSIVNMVATSIVDKHNLSSNIQKLRIVFRIYKE